MQQKALLIAFVVIVIVAVIMFARQSRRPAEIGESTIDSTVVTTEAESSPADEEKSAAPTTEVAITLAEMQPDDSGRTRFEITNHGEHTIHFPDTWFLSFHDRSFKMLPLPLAGNIRLAPGKSQDLLIDTPTASQPWRLGSSYLTENLGYRAKIAIGDSRVGRHLPAKIASIHGVSVVGDWIENVPARKEPQ